MRPKLSLKGRALALLAQREHSPAELRRKLLRHARSEAVEAAVAAVAAASSPFDGPDDAALAEAAASIDETAIAARLDELLDWLRTHKYLSEERFVESRVHARAARYGQLRIRQELAQHGLKLNDETAQALKASEFERAAEVLRHKFPHAPATPAERARQSRFLASRGFASEVVARLVRAGAARGRDDAEVDEA